MKTFVVETVLGTREQMIVVNALSREQAEEIVDSELLNGEWISRFEEVDMSKIGVIANLTSEDT